MAQLAHKSIFSHWVWKCALKLVLWCFLTLFTTYRFPSVWLWRCFLTLLTQKWFLFSTTTNIFLNHFWNNRYLNTIIWIEYEECIWMSQVIFSRKRSFPNFTHIVHFFSMDGEVFLLVIACWHYSQTYNFTSCCF